MDRVTIAVVEDDASVREALVSLLETEGWVIAAYPSGEAFLSALDGNEPPTCILLDLILPGMNGVDLLEHLRAPAVSTVVLTAYPHSTLAARARELGIEAMLLKPVETDELVSTLRGVVGEG